MWKLILVLMGLLAAGFVSGGGSKAETSTGTDPGCGASGCVQQCCWFGQGTCCPPDNQH